ncbi:NAD-dependent epimerase/dehydratase family protein [Ignicoccus hospitalis]|uniref:NAD-dependent epimerase/dehydratase n=1 Tax=Ignicoccus hospitalis (strain KIN4/I / DSM 18386 / JCM 14125) TaxID=453591 RepID=A8AB70_IGNH4|nr:NAD-dependent epimerase/dehydratase family protein [Ignicoccus hospitalis]ABU82172.1 NAD-dependent epimerase/dehydratase [Ignicoccus hospitalis KIN4/I]HIH91129.1 NAD-dependent epimerase/dehydratase family protein [Desulfurococcaceae archaeon]
MICITGGSGYIGSKLVEELLKEGEVKVLDLAPPPVPHVKFTRVNVLLLDDLKVELRDCELVYHLAAEIKAEESLREPAKVVRVNVEGTLNVLEAARLADASVVFASTAAVYGEAKVVPVPEEHPLEPVNVYGATKVAGEALVNSYRKAFGLRAWTLRLFNVYGPSASPSRGVVGEFLRRALKGEPLRIYGDGRQVRDFVFVDDVVKAFKLVREIPEGTYNVGSGRGVSIITLAKKIIELTGSKSEMVFLPERPGDVRVSVADVTKLAAFGWRPRVSLEEGLRLTAEALKARGT